MKKRKMYCSSKIENADNLDSLFYLWKQAHKFEENYEETTITKSVKTKKGIFEGISRESFIKDGYICENEYINAPKKVLFILKEANIQTYRSQWQLDNPSEDSQVGFYTEYINNEKSDNLPKQCEKMGRMAYYIFFDEDTTDFTKIRSALNKTAFMNVNKRGGGASTDEKIFWNYEQKYAPYIQRQIELLNPDVIVIIGKNISELIIPDEYKNRFIKVFHTAFRYKKGIYNPNGYIKEFIKEYENAKRGNE